MMLRRLLAALGVVACAAPCWAAEFESPVRLKAGEKYIRTESPGYACPTWADVDGDGKKELVVGQFAKGKMKVYKHLGGMKFDEGKWLEADGKVAEVQGVW